jgi:hypothetical protein|uniref:Uncharacterized protein n=1 Tax=Siphoviridae sp. ctZD11 TaxID=2825556 RepID=A0A8S5U543_9CAUD|nr:MAG TPA: protein of unknown function (DUF5048) [Siphoviridae sp. ctZD11]
MKSVSNAYKASMKAMLRNRSYVRITFGNVDTTAATDGEWESNGAASISEFETVDYAYQYGDTYVSLELNRWALDGKSLLVPTGEDVQDGFISSLMSDAEGNFTTPPVITREFSLKHIFPGLTLTFDTRQQEWPLEVTADFYLNGEVVDTQTVSITSVQTTITTTATEVDKVTITFDRCLPYRRPRLENVLYGLNVQFVNKDIVSTQQKHDVDPLSRRLPTETMQFTILDYEHKYDPDNPAGIYAYVDKNSPIEIQFGYELPDGSVEWLKPDNYVLNAKPSAQNNQATFNGTGLIGSLTGTFYKSKLGSKSLYNMAEEVLLDAGLTLTEQGTNPWEIDEALKDMFTTAALPIDTHMNCLQLISHAACCRLYTDDDNIIHIRPFGVTVIGIYNGVWADNGHVWFSEWDTIDKGNTAENTYVTFELNRWTLGGDSQIILPDSNAGQRGYISEAMTGADGSFTNPPVFTKTFDVPHDLPVLAIRFDTVLNEFPGAVQVKYYHDDTLLDTQTAAIDSVEVYVSSNLAIECTKIEVTMIGNLPYRRGRVTKVYYRETDFTLDFTSIGENSQKISKIDELKSVSVARYSYTASNDTSTLYEGTTTETELHVEFSGLAQDVQISVSGGTLVSSNIYARAADLVLSSGTKTVTITGKTLTENSVVVSYPVAQSGEIDKEENPLITNDTMCQALANHVKSYLQMRNTYEANYRGNPEMEVGDIIGLQTLYTDEMDALILVDEITFDGSLSGKMTVKGLI